MKRIVWLAACAASLNGCGYNAMFNGTSTSMSGAGVVLRKPYEPYSAPELAGLIVAAAPAAPTSSVPTRLEDASGRFAGYDLDSTIGWFSKQLYTAGGGAPADPTAPQQNALREARNEIQGMLLTASANRCNAFKLQLREKSTSTNFILGSLATSLGAAGAIVTGGASQALAGAAAAVSGTNSEYNKDILSNVTSAVIIPGIDKQRSGILQEITNRRCYGVSSYSLTDALLDAVRYHTACSTDVGVAAASSALSQSGTAAPATKGAMSDGGSVADHVKTIETAMQTHDPAAATAAAGTINAAQAAAPANQAPAGGNGAASATSDSAAKPSTVLVGDAITYAPCGALQADGTVASH